MNEISFVINGCAEVVTGEGSHVFPRQTHRSYIFGTLISGAEVIRIGDRSARLVPGDCYILPPDTPIEMYPEGRSGYISLCLKGRLAELIGGCRPDGFFAKNKGGALLRQTDLICGGRFDGRRLVKELTEDFSLRQRAAVPHDSPAARAAEYLDGHCDEKFDLDALARAVCLSKYHLVREFGKNMGVTPKLFHQQCRLRRAKEMILTEKQSDVAFDLSFSSQSHLESVFAKNMGLTLGQYRASVTIRRD